MKPAQKRGERPVVLDKRGEEILRAVHFYRYMTALDVANLLYSPSSITHVRGLLALLCGGGDYIGNQYLCRFGLPSIAGGNPERIYILGSRGREYLKSEGLAVKWYFSAGTVKRLSYSQVMHNLVLTRVLVAAQRWAKSDQEFKLTQVRICYELGSVSVDVDERGKGEKVAVVPDAWLLFEKLERGHAPVAFPVLLEIDRGTMFRARFKRHVVSRIEFVRSGGYSQMFGRKGALIAYATTGQTGEIREGRRKALCLWTKEALKETGRESWGQIFRFHSLALRDIYKSALFEDKAWYRPDQEQPVGLFGQ